MPRRVEGSSKRKFIKKDSLSIEMCKHIKAKKKSRECIKMTKNHQSEKNKEGKMSPKVHSIKRKKKKNAR